MNPELLDVIVIGAGAAGVAAAERLVAASKQTLVLEARDRIGGRIDTLHDPYWPVPIERGAEFIHGQPRETLDLVRDTHRVAYDVTDTHWQFHDGHLQPQRGFWETMEKVFRKIEHHHGPDQTLDQFLAERHDLSDEVKRLTSSYVEGFDAADRKQVGIEWIKLANRAEDKLGEGLMRIVGGYQPLIEHLALPLRKNPQMLRLKTVVKRIEWSRRSVSVHTVDGQSFAARSTIITLPLGVLQSQPSEIGAVEFAPPLLEKQQTLGRLRMGGVVKVVLRFDEPFWEEKIDRELCFFHAPGEPIPTWWTTLPLRTPVLTGWAGGPHAARFAGKPMPQILSIAIDSLARVLKVDEIHKRLRGSHVSDWLSDPFARGAYSYGAVGGATAADELAQPIDQTLFFAGEATHHGMSGTVAGAIASGRRAAAECIEHSS